MVKNSSDKTRGVGIVIMAAGYGRRFGGNKQLIAIGPGEATVVDYTIFDAWRIGYSWVTIILRNEIQEDFERTVGVHWKEKISISYSVQEHQSFLPTDCVNEVFVSERVLPWGTTHAVLCAKQNIQGPFVVVNADDFYGYSSLQKAFIFLQTIEPISKQSGEQCMIGFSLGDTLSENGKVSRGICTVKRDQSNQKYLHTIREHKNIRRTPDSSISYQKEDGEEVTLAKDTITSMNLFGFQYQMLFYLEREFANFIESLRKHTAREQMEAECVLPDCINSMIQHQEIHIRVLDTEDTWFGLTYASDIQKVKDKVKSLIADGIYPPRIT